VRIRLRHLALCATAILNACQSDTDSQAWLERIETVASPAATGSRYPQLGQGADGFVVMSWLQPASGGHELRFSTWHGRGWTESRTVATGPDFFVNWADFPSVVPGPGNLRVAHWLQSHPANAHSYDVRIVASTDSGRSWSEPIVPHEDGTATEHGFVSLLRDGDAWLAIWLDGRETAAATHDEAAGSARNEAAASADDADEMSLRYARIDDDGTLVGPSQALDARVCDCCRTGAAMTARGPIVVYRDRTETEVRDIAIVGFENGSWSAPRLVHADRWQIAGCPVNGPAVAALGNFVAVAWFTAPDQPRVRLAFSSDSGRTFAAPIEVARGRVTGRVDVALLDDGRAAVSWLDEASTHARILVQAFDQHGEIGDAVVVAETSVQRAAGFPRMARIGDRLLFAWTEPGEPAAIRTAVARLR
jgi:hypothetical protein